MPRRRPRSTQDDASIPPESSSWLVLAGSNGGLESIIVSGFLRSRQWTVRRRRVGTLRRSLPLMAPIWMGHPVPRQGHSLILLADMTIGEPMIKSRMRQLHVSAGFMRCFLQDHRFAAHDYESIGPLRVKTSRSTALNSLARTLCYLAFRPNDDTLHCPVGVSLFPKVGADRSVPQDGCDLLIRAVCAHQLANHARRAFGPITAASLTTISIDGFLDLFRN